MFDAFKTEGCDAGNPGGGQAAAERGLPDGIPARSRPPIQAEETINHFASEAHFVDNNDHGHALP
jgi:hypothetical protein